VPWAFTAKTRSHSSAAISSSGKLVMIPAHVTRPSIRPNSRSARSNTASISGSDVTSARWYLTSFLSSPAAVASRSPSKSASTISRTLAAGGVRDGTAHAGRGTGHDDDLIAKAQKVGHGGPS